MVSYSKLYFGKELADLNFTDLENSFAKEKPDEGI